MRDRGYWNVLVTAAVIAGLEFTAPTLTAQTPVPAGRVEMVPVLGHSMRVRTAGLAERRPGQPILVLEGGAVQSIDTWDPIFDRLAAMAPVVAYDRRGIGRSEFAEGAQTLEHVNESLHALLTAMTAPPPYVLVGHSYGGVLIRAFARKYPTEVAGLVYLDTPDTDLTIADLNSVDPGGLRLLRSELDSLPSNLPVGMRAELDNIRQLMAGDLTQLNAVRPPAGIPAAALVAAAKVDQLPDPAERAIRRGIIGIQIRHQQEWALSSPDGLFVVTRRGGHNIHHDNADLAISAIRHILTTTAVR